MITYELAKKLKDAGFPQRITVSKKCVCEHGGKDLLHILHYEITPNLFEQHFIHDGFLTFPSLEELIEACGDSLSNMLHYAKGNVNAGKWQCDNWEFERAANPIQTTNWIRTLGDTPEEAVALFFLELNKK